MKIIALYSVKGGVGKTASCVNLAYLAATAGFRTLLCDLDPQGSATYYFRIRPNKKLNQKKLLKGGKSIDKNIKGTDFPNLDLLPADISYRNLDIALDDMKRSKKRLRDVLKPLKSDYELVFLDCPPNITLLSENIFLAANLIMTPVIPTTLSGMTYQKLLDFFREHKLDKRKLYPFFSMIERRKKLHKEMLQEFPNKIETGFFASHIPYASAVERMGVSRMPVHCFQPGSKAAKAYESLWNELREIISAE